MLSNILHRLQIIRFVFFFNPAELLVVSQENNVKASLPLDFTQEQYDNEDRK